MKFPCSEDGPLIDSENLIASDENINNLLGSMRSRASKGSVESAAEVGENILKRVHDERFIRSIGLASDENATLETINSINLDAEQVRIRQWGRTVVIGGVWLPEWIINPYLKR